MVRAVHCKPLSHSVLCKHHMIILCVPLSAEEVS